MTKIDDDPIKGVRERYNHAYAAKRAVVAKMNRAYAQGYQAKYWPRNHPAWATKVTLHLIFSTIETMVASVTDSIPIITANPGNKAQTEDVNLAQIYNPVLAHVQHKMGLRRFLAAVVRDMLTYGKGFLKDYSGGIVELPKAALPEAGAWDRLKNLFRRQQMIEYPRLRVACLDPYAAYLDPEAEALEDASYVILQHGRSHDYLAAKYGAVARNLPATGSTETQLEEAPDRRAQRQEGETAAKHSSIFPHTTRECWYDGGSKFVTVCGDVVLHDPGKNPFPQGGMPLVDFDCYPQTHAYWGEGIIPRILPLEMALAKLLSSMIDHAKYTAAPVVKHAGGVVGRLKSMPGAKWKFRTPEQAAAAGFVQPPPMAQGLFQLAEMLRRFYDGVSGVHDVAQGRRPRGITAARAIEALQEAIGTRLGQIVRNLEDSLSLWGENLLVNVVGLYPREMVERIVGPEEMSAWRALSPVEIRECFDVKADVNSALPTSKVQQAQMAMSLYQMGAIDREALLEAVEFAGKDAVLERMQQAQGMLGQIGEEGGEEGLSAEQADALRQEFGGRDEPSNQRALPQGWLDTAGWQGHSHCEVSSMRCRGCRRAGRRNPRQAQRICSLHEESWA